MKFNVYHFVIFLFFAPTNELRGESNREVAISATMD